MTKSKDLTEISTVIEIEPNALELKPGIVMTNLNISSTACVHVYLCVEFMLWRKKILTEIQLVCFEYTDSMLFCCSETSNWWRRNDWDTINSWRTVNGWNRSRMHQLQFNRNGKKQRKSLFVKLIGWWNRASDFSDNEQKIHYRIQRQVYLLFWWLI